jgi:hypothetical protein
MLMNVHIHWSRVVIVGLGLGIRMVVVLCVCVCVCVCVCRSVCYHQICCLHLISALKTKFHRVLYGDFKVFVVHVDFFKNALFKSSASFAGHRGLSRFLASWTTETAMTSFQLVVYVWSATLLKMKCTHTHQWGCNGTSCVLYTPFGWFSNTQKCTDYTPWLWGIRITPSRC